MANLNVGGEIKAPIITATETINCDTLNVWFGGAKVIDSGSNANGYWVRFADGTQICRSKITVSGTAASFQTRTLPKEFVNTDYRVVMSYSDVTSTTTISYRAVSIRNRTTTTFNSFNANDRDYIAIGRWK